MKGGYEREKTVLNVNKFYKLIYKNYKENT